MAIEFLSKIKVVIPDLTQSLGLTRLSLSPMIEGETCPLLLSEDHELTYPGMGKRGESRILTSSNVSRSPPSWLPPEAMQTLGKEP